MAVHLTEEQIIQLAPDASSVKAGKGLSTTTKWVLRQQSGRALWGHCQGSGKTPYQTIIDLDNIAFKCSCPSRKFPCKHGLGLLLLAAAQPGVFSDAEEPEWVTAWLSKRQESAEKKEQKAKERQETPVDEAAQAKRLAARHKKVLAGIEDLQTFLQDILRNGLLGVSERVYTLFEGVARRMVDAQASGLASRLMALEEIDYYNDQWKYQLTDELSRIYLLCESYKNLENLPPEWQVEVKSRIGYPQSKEEVLATEGIKDVWIVLSKESRKQQNIPTEIYWLYGKHSGRFATWLYFATPGSLPEQTLLIGSRYTGVACYYPGIGASRIQLKEWSACEEEFLPAFLPGLGEAMQAYRDSVALNPFIEAVPVLVEGLQWCLQGTQWYLCDAHGKQVAVSLPEEARIRVLSITGGRPFSGFLLAHTHHWQLVSVWYKSVHYFWEYETN